MSKVEFGDLPPSDVLDPWGAVAAQLRERPGQWARVIVKLTPVSAAYTAAAIGEGFYRSLPAGQFEAVSRGCDVWARYVGDDQ